VTGNESWASSDAADVCIRFWQRAIERSPVNVWYRLASAERCERWGRIEESTAAWQVVESLRCVEPAWRRALATRQWSMGHRAEAMESIRQYLRWRPHDATELLKSLNPGSVTDEEIASLAPESNVAFVQLLGHLRERGVNAWRRLGVERLDAIVAGATVRRIGLSEAEERAALATLAIWLGRSGEAVDDLTRALNAEPDRNDWKLQLAELLYERKDYAAGDAMAASLLRTEPTGERADRARLLREKIKLAGGAAPAAVDATETSQR
jgi:tetratricopeptide (TPR) repeat protein